MKFSINMSIGSGETEEWIDIIKEMKIQIIVLNQQIMKQLYLPVDVFGAWNHPLDRWME